MTVPRVPGGEEGGSLTTQKCMRILSVHGKLSVIERCPY